MSTTQERDKSIDEITRSSGIDARLIRAVIRQTGRENLEDIARHGAGAGYAGLTWYSDTVAFFKRNRMLIRSLVEQQAEELGETPLDMVAGFNCLAGREIVRGNYSNHRRENSKIMAEYYPSISRCLYGAPLTDDDTQVANALTWFAAEEVARAFHQDI